MASAITVPSESIGTKSRSTTDGRRITYHLSVVQQPERARACGQGAKSSTDRRPVDPPPIIELRVFEGEDNNQSDITFSHKANFFLFATLESARSPAHGRGSQNQSNNIILTGSSVAGMSYLDRPNPAGYFIFPDLSVRHEGTYRLAFTLFEELKDQRDTDPKDRESAPARAGQDHVSGRAEVRTIPFTVFSAKKFPGLAESTALSRLVADQGCRVRIRRDVRMRRRETKSGKDLDEFEDDVPERETPHPPYNRNHPSAAEPPAEKVRQLERPTNMSSNVPHLKHSSSQDFGQQYQPPYSAPNQTPQQTFGQPMSYESKTMPQFQYQSQPQPTHYPSQHQMMQASPHMGQYQQYQYPPGMMHYAQTQFHTPGGYLPQQQMQSPTYDQSVSGMRQDGLHFVQMNPDHRLSQTQQYHPQGQQAAPLGPMENGFPRSPPPPPQGSIYSKHNSNHSTSGPASASGKDLPPLQTQAPQAHPTPTSITSPTSGGIREGSMSSYNYASRPVPPPPQYSTDTSFSRKRSYASAFDTKYMDQPLRDGQRPSTSGVDNTDASLRVGFDSSSSSDDDQFELSGMKMKYRRADGTEVVRGWPPF